MLTVPSNDPLPLADFQIGDYVYVPDHGTVKVTLKDAEGTAIHEKEVSFDADFSIPQDLLNVSSSEVLSFFQLRVIFTSEGRQRIFTDVVRAHTNMLLTIEPQQVRSLLGLYEEELPDKEIDFIYSFSELIDEIGSTFLSDTLSRKNKMILLHEAKRHLPTLALKALKSNKIDDSQKSRQSDIDITKIQEDVLAQYWSLKVTFDGVDELPQEPLVEFIARTDVFTGSDE